MVSVLTAVGSAGESRGTGTHRSPVWRGALGRSRRRASPVHGSKRFTSLEKRRKTVRGVASIIAGVGVAGIPEAGLIVLPLVLSAAGLPDHVIIAAIPLVMTVNWIITRARSGVNVMSDMLVAILLDAGRVTAATEPVAIPYQSEATHPTEPQTL